MKRVIYSLYVDVPAKEHYGNSKIKYDTIDKASITVNAFKKHYDKCKYYKSYQKNNEICCIKFHVYRIYMEKSL